MRTIYRYDLELQHEQLITLPRNAEILTVDRQTRLPLGLSLWALINTDEPVVDRKIILVGTGTEDPNEAFGGVDAKFIATFQEPSGFVWHFFDGGEEL